MPIKSPSPEVLQEAVKLLCQSKIIGLPTETVYGLAGNGLDEKAIQEIYRVKGRPSNNPLIFHVRNTEAAKELVEEWPESAEILTQKFWPGPMTIVLPVRNDLESIALAGGRTIALRCPQHPVALELLRELEFPLVAPSANKSGTLSPVTAEHVFENFHDSVPLILDGGTCHVGLESTVLDLTDNQVRVLRPGILNEKHLRPLLEVNSTTEETVQVILKSPGLLSRHYAPSKPLRVLTEERKSVGENAIYLRITSRGEGIHLGCAPQEVASKLYRSLWDAQKSSAEIILIDCPPRGEEWNVIRDRLRRAVENPEALSSE